MGLAPGMGLPSASSGTNHPRPSTRMGEYELLGLLTDVLPSARSLSATLLRKSNVLMTLLMRCNSGPKPSTVIWKVSEKRDESPSNFSTTTDLMGCATDSPNCKRLPWVKSTWPSACSTAACMWSALGLRSVDPPYDTSMSKTTVSPATGVKGEGGMGGAGASAGGGGGEGEGDVTCTVTLCP